MTTSGAAKTVGEAVARGLCRGHPVVYDHDAALWRWEDTGEPVEEWPGGTYRACVKCGEMPTPEGHDACLGTLPDGVTSACCGHGVERGYVIWEGQQRGVRQDSGE